MPASPPAPPKGDPPAAEYGTAADVCLIVKASKSALERLHASEGMPRPVYFGRCRRWHLGEIRRWLAAGCPSRADWEHSQR